MKFLRRLRAHSRPIFFWVIGLAIVAAPAVGTLYGATHWPRQPADQLTLVGVIATVAAAWLAFVAAGVALLAYLLADESPDLSVLINGRPLADGLDLQLRESKDGKHPIRAPDMLVFALVNRNSFSARNPAVRIRFIGMQIVGLFPRDAPPEWHLQSPWGEDITVLWNGGADISVHGHWNYDLPPIPLHVGATWARSTVSITIEVVAEGFHLAPHTIPIRANIESQQPTA
jgi:hypothetical protein